MRDDKAAALSPTQPWLVWGAPLTSPAASIGAVAQALHGATIIGFAPEPEFVRRARAQNAPCAVLGELTGLPTALSQLVYWYLNLDALTEMAAPESLLAPDVRSLPGFPADWGEAHDAVLTLGPALTLDRESRTGLMRLRREVLRTTTVGQLIERQRMQGRLSEGLRQARSARGLINAAAGRALVLAQVRDHILLTTVAADLISGAALTSDRLVGRGRITRAGGANLALLRGAANVSLACYQNLRFANGRERGVPTMPHSRFARFHSSTSLAIDLVSRVVSLVLTWDALGGSGRSETNADVFRRFAAVLPLVVGVLDGLVYLAARAAQTHHARVSRSVGERAATLPDMQRQAFENTLFVQETRDGRTTRLVLDAQLGLRVEYTADLNGNQHG